MKKAVLLLIAVFVLSTSNAQIAERLTFATSIGTGVAMSTPASTPFAWQVAGYYHFNERLSAGFGTGLSIYEKLLVPLFADVRFTMTQPRKVTPYVGCSAGYSFAVDQYATGGLYLNPSLGLQYALCSTKKLFLAIGYEWQKLARLQTYENTYFEAEFEEQLAHNVLSLKVGFMF